MRRMLPLLVLTACHGGVDDAFFVRRDGADLPVWLQGDAKSDTLVLVQHGLGSSGRFYDWLPAFDALESRYAVVYWDRRGAGISQGNAPAQSLTVEAQVDDLRLVLDVVRHRYDPVRVVLLGHSLGGGVSLSFLREVPAGVDGYVDVSGGRSLPEAYATAAARIVAHAAARADDPALTQAERDDWAAAPAFYAEHPGFPQGDARDVHAGYVERVSADQGFDLVGSTASMAAAVKGRSVGDMLGGGFDAVAYAVNTGRFGREFDSASMDLAPSDIAAITVPTLVVAGRYDLSVPWEVCQATADALGHQEAPSRFLVLERSGHFPFWDEGEAFEEAVTGFVDGLR